MEISLAFCRFAYETIIGKELPSDMAFAHAAELALKADREWFMKLAKEAGYKV